MPTLDDFAEPIRSALASLLSRGTGDVAFDADGTLWRGDVGEELLRALAHERRLASVASEGVFADYERRVEKNPSAAYTWAVEVMAGLDEAVLVAKCEDLFEARFSGRLFRWVRPLVALLESSGLKCWVVSASPIWAVRPGAAALGIDPARVIGVTCPVVGGKLTGRVDVPIPCGEGKVFRLKEKGCRPALGVGNGDLDLPMLAFSEAALAVATHQGPDNLLIAEAKKRGWPVVRS